MVALWLGRSNCNAVDLTPDGTCAAVAGAGPDSERSSLRFLAARTYSLLILCHDCLLVLVQCCAQF